MEELRHDGWVIDFDAAATRTAYESAKSSAESCTCAYCRTFVTLRDRHYSRALLELLHRLGIHPHKEAEVSEMGPGSPGKRFYSGFYHFVGSIRRDPGDRMSPLGSEPETVWQVFFKPGRDLLPHSFGDRPIVQLEFHVELPEI